MVCNYTYTLNKYGIEVLTEKALISINEKNGILMHDLLEEMGKEIVRQESPTEPGERSRLWRYEDVYRVFMENTASEIYCISYIYISSSRPTSSAHRMNGRGGKIHLNSESFSKMKNLQIFVTPRDIFTGDHVNYLSNELRLLVWECCPLSAFPPSFYPKKLVVLRMPGSQTSPLGEVQKTMQNLKSIDMPYCHGVRKISGLSMYPNLVDLYLHRCMNLVEVEVGYVKNLVNLNLSDCKKLENFQVCFPVASEIPEWFTFRMSFQRLPQPKDIYYGRGVEVYKFRVEIPGNFKLWESKGGLAFCIHHIDVNYYMVSFFRLRTIYINGVCIIQELEEDHYWRKLCGNVWLNYIPFLTIIRRLSEAGIGLTPSSNSFLVNFEFEYGTGMFKDTVMWSFGVHVVIPEFDEYEGVSVPVQFQHSLLPYAVLRWNTLSNGRKVVDMLAPLTF
ncbi:hypothetical protein ACLB2K_021178 [Fragaria x ananassa]